MADKKDMDDSAAAEEQERLLGGLRERIDELDEQMLVLLNERAKCVIEVADVKQRFANGRPPLFYRPEREAQVLRTIVEKNEGPLSDEKVAALFRQVMSTCLALEQPMTVAYLGPEGTFTQMAAFKHFGHAIRDKPTLTVDDIFKEVESGASNYGVVPVENSSEGIVNHTLDNFLDSTLRICGEVQLPIHHHLMVSPDSERKAPARIYSHQQTLAQCRHWLDAHWPNVPRVAVSSNAEAARLVLSEPDAAAIAGDVAAELYGLRIIDTRIEDRLDNTTRFLVVGQDDVRPSGNDKTSIMVSTRNQPGALYHVLEPFHRDGISLTALETRPSRTGMWSYVFFIDFEGHREDAKIIKLLSEIDQDALEVKMLGSYPRAFN